MSDLNIPENTNNSTNTGGTVPPVNTPPTEPKDPFAGSSDVLNTDPAPMDMNPPTVVVPAGGNSIPKGFLLLFIFILILFAGVTIFLVNTLMKNGGNPFLNKSIPTPSAKVTRAVPTPTIILSPSPTATDSSLLQISKLTGSDEIGDIELDIKNTDLSVIDVKNP